MFNRIASRVSLLLLHSSFSVLYCVVDEGPCYFRDQPEWERSKTWMSWFISWLQTYLTVNSLGHVFLCCSVMQLHWSVQEISEFFLLAYLSFNSLYIQFKRCFIIFEMFYFFVKFSVKLPFMITYLINNIYSFVPIIMTGEIENVYFIYSIF